jgi:hypothetical protein
MRFFQVPATADDVEGHRRRHPTPAEMSALAALHRNLTIKKHARLVLHHNGFSGSSELVDGLLDRVSAIASERRRRAMKRIEARLGTVPQWAMRHLLAAAPPSVSASTPQSRLEQLRKTAIVSAAKSCLRHGAAGGSSFQVRLTKNPAEVGYTVTIESNRDTYRGRFKGWAATEDHHAITAPIDWRVRVLKRGLATTGGMLTLDLHPLVGQGDIELFQAVWVSQARGYGVAAHRGVIARLGSEVFHAADAQDAIRGVTRKLKLATEPAKQRVSAYALSVEGFLARYGRYGDIPVSVEDARDTGACEYGIRSWCQAVGIDPEEGCVELSRVLAGFRTHPMVEVRRTVLHAIHAWRRIAR